MSIREYLPKVDSFNARLAAAEKTLAALHVEREILRTQGGEYMFVSEADKQLGKLTWKITLPEGFVAPASAPEQPAGQTIVRHPEQAA
jgi:hypothetical protein